MWLQIKQFIIKYGMNLWKALTSKATPKQSVLIKDAKQSTVKQNDSISQAGNGPKIIGDGNTVNTFNIQNAKRKPIKKKEIKAQPGNKSFEEHRAIQKSEAARQILGKARTLIKEVKDIAGSPGVYQYKSHKTETADETEKPHPERPSRIMLQKVEQFENDTEQNIAQISGKEESILLKWRSDLKLYIKSLAYAAYEKITDRNKEFTIQAYKTMENCDKILNQRLAEAEKILIPIIENRKA